MNFIRQDDSSFPFGMSPQVAPERHSGDTMYGDMFSQTLHLSAGAMGDECGTRSSSSSSISGSSTTNKMPVSKKNNSKKTRMPSTFVPSLNAVICGRGKSCTSNPGNRKLRALIRESLDKYGKAANKVEKTEIVTNIIETIKQGCPDQPGFLKKEDGVWWEVDDAFAREKIGCIFRDQLFTKYRSSTKAKLARRKQQELQEEHLQQIACPSFNASLNTSPSAPSPSLMATNVFSSGSCKQTMPIPSPNTCTVSVPSSVGSNNRSWTANHQQQTGLFVDETSASQRKDILRLCSSMMNLPSGNQPSQMEASAAMNEAFELLRGLRPASSSSAHNEKILDLKDFRESDLSPAKVFPVHQPISFRNQEAGNVGHEDDLPDDISGIFD
mmetsp:Transcript_27951/g.52411  ORF Transcript_27951/g.52411 Transcript_27951/m.52411 type:complete len:384 (+) Transcript_27951:414-1565(+)|eukprot:CAMPEP_0178754422 /NCGR_PEP_ID=MMETSP0744-20121128/12149_1 /TAXON_ID=913974 /ORGANISM="Nitzschia punctata, Strain CCMP561" /LENGTH=383 /DNA_ID=CAMNT_0020408329 /DNA_START=290 /DNA_END=1441 /DNA_ORIENTATION=+